MKNTGSETPAVATTLHVWSIQEPCFTAAKIPSGTAMTMDRISPNSVSSADAGRRLVISVATGRPVDSELPKLPCARSLT